MSKFLILRTDKGVCFSLVADNGRRLAVSRTYATLDACKKGIASLIVNAPVVPLVDSSAGQTGANPKFEIVAVGDGVGFLLKSANGKSVITSARYATKKACLRAISMLRSGVSGACVFLQQEDGVVPVVMTAHLVAVGAVADPCACAARVNACSPSLFAEPERADMPLDEDAAGAVDVDNRDDTPVRTDAAVADCVFAERAVAAPPSVAVPRLVRLKQTPVIDKQPVTRGAPPRRQAARSSARSSRKLLDLLFKRK